VTAERATSTTASTFARVLRDPHDGAAATPVVRGIVRSHVETAVGVLRAHLAKPWTLDSLANEVHVSRSELVRAFDTVTSLGAKAYLRLMRVHQMARLLTHSDLSVGVIASTPAGRLWPSGRTGGSWLGLAFRTGRTACRNAARASLTTLRSVRNAMASMVATSRAVTPTIVARAVIVPPTICMSMNPPGIGWTVGLGCGRSGLTRLAAVVVMP
jgi:AraC-like DNA-binding protein